MSILRNVKQLIARRVGLERELNEIDRLLAPFGAVEAGKIKLARGRKGKRTMSAAAKARMSAAAKLRWKEAKAAGRSRL